MKTKPKSNMKKTDKRRKLINCALIVFSISVVIFAVIGAMVIDNFSYMQQVEELSKIEEKDDTYKGEIDDRLRFIAMQEEELAAVNQKQNNPEQLVGEVAKEQADIEEPEPIALFLENEENPKTKFMEYNEKYRKKDVDSSDDVNVHKMQGEVNLKGLDLKNQVLPPSSMNMKVVIGDFSTKEAALHELADTSSQFSAPPFVKVVNGSYVIQVASFKTPETAYEFVNSLRQQGFSARIIEE